jgi:hypothetical protein
MLVGETCLGRPQFVELIALFDTLFVHSNISEDSWIQGAKWGATADSLQATPGHCQPPSTQLDPMSGDARTPPDTDRRYLLSSGSRVRILPGALTCGND